MTQATYDRIAAAYQRRSSVVVGPFRDFRASFVAELAPTATVVDIGCGPGRDLVAFGAAGLRAAGVDGSAAMVRLARAAGARVVRGDLRAPPLRLASVEALWSGSVTPTSRT